jgi:hypothetical protein
MDADLRDSSGDSTDVSSRSTTAEKRLVSPEYVVKHKACSQQKMNAATTRRPAALVECVE